MNFYLFPKAFQGISAESMLETAAEAGFDGVTALIRDGFWLRAATLDADLTGFQAAAGKAGLTVDYADTDLPPEQMGSHPAFTDQLRCLAAHGITRVRMRHIAKPLTGNMRMLADNFAHAAEATALEAEKAGVRAVIQLHGLCYPHNATAAWPALRGLDPRYIGIKLDPGNNVTQEGTELYEYQIGLLSEYIAALGAKDGAWFRSGDHAAPDGGWRPSFVPAYEGMTDYRHVFALLSGIGFDGPVILMPFYQVPEGQRLADTIAGELRYFKDCAGK